MTESVSKNRRAVFYIVVSFFWFSLYAYVPYVTPYGEYLGADMRLLGLIAGAYGFTQMLIRIPLGLLSDKLRRRKIFVQLGLLLAAVGAFLAFFFPSPHMLLIMRGIGGFAAAAWVTFTVLGASYYKSEETAKSMGYLSSANAFGRMIALLTGGLIAQWLGISYAFLLGGIAGIVGLVISFGVAEKRPEIKNEEVASPLPEGSGSGIHSRCSGGVWGSAPLEKVASLPRTPLKELAAVARNKQLLCCSILGILAMYISFATTFGFTPIAATMLDASQFQLGLLGVLSTAPAIFISPLAGNIMPKKLGAAATLAIGFVLAGAGTALVAISHSLWSLFAVQIVGSIGGAISGTLLLGLCIRDIPAERRATAMGFFQAVYGIGMFLGPFATGYISHGFGLMAAFLFTGAIGLLGALLAIVFAKKGVLRY